MEPNDRRPGTGSSGGGDRALDAAAYNLPYSEIGGLQIAIEQRAGTIRQGDGMNLLPMNVASRKCGAAMTIEIEPPPNDKHGRPLVDLTPFLRMSLRRSRY